MRRSLRGLVLANATALAVAITLVPATPAHALAHRFATNSGCAVNGYCWFTQGPKTDDPSASNGMTFKLNNSMGLANVASYVQGSINAINGAGSSVTLKWGGNTTDTGTSSVTPWLVRTVSATAINSLGGACVDALACTRVTPYSSADYFSYRCTVFINGTRYAQGGSTWQATFIHEMAHCLGLAHFDGTYLGVYQLMHTSAQYGANSIQTGDANGIKNVTKPV